MTPSVNPFWPAHQEKCDGPRRFDKLKALLILFANALFDSAAGILTPLGEPEVRWICLISDVGCFADWQNVARAARKTTGTAQSGPCLYAEPDRRDGGIAMAGRAAGRPIDKSGPLSVLRYAPPR
jgi:hypothetical protein